MTKLNVGAVWEELELPTTKLVLFLFPKSQQKILCAEVLKVSDQHLSKNKDEDLPDGKSDTDAEESLLSSPDERPAQST